MKNNLILAFVAVVVVISGCAPAHSVGLMEIEPLGTDPNLGNTAKVNLINDTGKTLFFRMFDVANNMPIGLDMQLDPNEQKTITPNANQYYNYLIFTNKSDKDPVYRFNNAWFSAGITYSLYFAKTANGKK